MGAILRPCSHGEVLYIRMARTLLGRPLYWTGAYLVDGLLIDCGPPALAGELLRALEGRTVETVVLTHHHEDHVGAAWALETRRGLRPYAHPAAVSCLQQGFRIQVYRRVVWGVPRPVEALPLGSEVRSRRLRFEVVHTPGHSPDHVCLFQPENGWLFTGDLFLGERVRYLRADEDLEALVGSIDALLTRPVRELFCAHRGPVAEGAAALARKAQGLRRLGAEVRQLRRRGLSERQIARRTLQGEGAVRWLSLGHFSARNLVRAAARLPEERSPGGEA